MCNINIPECIFPCAPDHPHAPDTIIINSGEPGPQGPPGEAGPRGCRGSIGPAGPAESLSGIQAQLTGKPMLLANNAIVPFSGLVGPSNPHITFDAGQFTINTAGTYMVHWQVATDGSDVDAIIAFAVAVNGAPQSSMSSPIVTGQVAGSAVIVASTGDIITLANVSNQNVQLAAVPVMANITIVG